MVKGERHPYTLPLENGQYIHLSIGQESIDLVVHIFDPSGEQIVEMDGPGVGFPEEWTFVPEVTGTYRLEMRAFESETAPTEGDYTIEFLKYLTTGEYQAELAAKEAVRQSAVSWVRESAVPLAGVEAGTGFDDMQPLKDIVGDARIVALGEATHGTREFFQLKHRMLEFLVTEMGFNIFAIEATMPEAFDVNEYVLRGKGDPAKALAGLYFWTWNTEEVLEMIRWMRRYNADPAHPTKVKFYGFDMQSGVRAFKVLHSYLTETASGDAELLREHPAISLMGDPYSATEFSRLPEGEKDDAIEILRGIIGRLDEVGGGTKDGDRWKIVRQHAEVLRQGLRRFSSIRPGSRDSSMAVNVEWIMDHEGPEARMVYWAHNRHVWTYSEASYVPMGRLLRERYGDDMVVFGFAFNQGSFQANRVHPVEFRLNGLRPFHVTPLEKESLDATLAEAGHPFMALDLRDLPDSGDAAEWFSEPRLTRMSGSAYSLEWNVFPSGNTSKTYDAFLFVNETTAARPNPGGNTPPQASRSEPANLGFEFDDAGVPPAHWQTRKHLHANFGYVVTTDSSFAYEGFNSLLISRPAGDHYGETHASVSQRLSARGIGKTIRVTGAVKSHVQSGDGAAYLWVRTLNRGSGRNAIACQDSMYDRPITGSEWAFYSVECEVGEKVQSILYGAAFSGVGSAWFDAFRVEVVENRR